MPNTEAINDPRYLERRLESLEAAVGATAPTHGGAITAVSPFPRLTNKTVGNTQATIAHGLSYTPKIVAIIMTSAGTIWRSAAIDATNIYLTADAASRTCDIVLSQ